MNLSHTRDLIADDDLWRPVAAPGVASLLRTSQPGRTVQLEAGSGVLMNNAEVGSILLPAASRFITFRVARDAMAQLVPDLDAAIARRIPAENAALRLLVNYLETARDTEALVTPELQHTAVTHIHDLLAIALGATRDATQTGHARGVRAARLRVAKAFILSHLERHDLSAADVAAHLGITPRYVHLLFETESLSFAKFVIDRRLARAHQMLLDPRMTERTISTIAFTVGFADLSHFNRAFKRQFGVTPSEARRAVR